MTMKNYRVTLFNDNGSVPDMPHKTVFCPVLQYSKEAARQWGEGMAISLGGILADKLVVHVEFMPAYLLEQAKAPPIDDALLAAVKRDSWYILGGMQSRIDLLKRDIEQSQRSLNHDDGTDVYKSLRNMVEEAQRIVREYTAARDRLIEAGLER